MLQFSTPKDHIYREFTTTKQIGSNDPSQSVQKVIRSRIGHHYSTHTQTPPLPGAPLSDCPCCATAAPHSLTPRCVTLSRESAINICSSATQLYSMHVLSNAPCITVHKRRLMKLMFNKETRQFHLQKVPLYIDYVMTPCYYSLKRFTIL